MRQTCKVMIEEVSGKWLYMQAYSNKEFRIPILGALAAKQLG